MDYQKESDARIVIDDLLRKAGWDPVDKSMVETEEQHRGPDPILLTVSAESPLAQIAIRFPLPWSAYVRLLAVKNEHARSSYETEALRGGWSVRQLDRQIDSQFYDRTTLSKMASSVTSRHSSWS